VILIWRIVSVRNFKELRQSLVLIGKLRFTQLYSEKTIQFNIPMSKLIDTPCEWFAKFIGSGKLGAAVLVYVESSGVATCPPDASSRRRAQEPDIGPGSKTSITRHPQQEPMTPERQPLPAWKRRKDGAPSCTCFSTGQHR
jgi:hypothetical protein